MKLRNRKSYMTSLPEGQPPENMRSRITQLLYYAVLLLVTGYILYIFGSKYLYFSEHGFVEVEKTLLSSSHGGKVLRLTVHEGQNITQGELLAVITPDNDCGVIDQSRSNKLNYDLALNRAKLSLLLREIQALKTQLSQSTLQRALETGQASDSISSKLNYDLLKKQNEIALLDSQILLQQQQLKPSLHSGLSSNVSSDCLNETITAPFSGHIHSVKHAVNEFTPIGKPLLVLIEKNAPVRIEAYLTSETLGSLNIGDTIDVTFPDRIKTEAKIGKIYSSAFTVPEREWNHYKPLDPQVRVHLMPLTAQDATVWKKYDRMEVTVKGHK